MSASYDRHGPQPLSVGSKDCIRNRWCNADDRSLPCACRRLVLAIHEHDLNFRHVAQSRYTVLREMSVQNASIVEANRFEQCATDAHHDRPLNLISQAIRIDDCSALEGFHN